MSRFIILLSFFSVCFSSKGNVLENSDTTKPAFSIQTGRNATIDSNILIVINGIPAGTIKELKKDINTMFPPDVIESVNVWKGEKAIEKFGKKGEYGAIEFILKNVSIKDAGISEVKNPDDKIFEKVEIEAAFAGGDAAWKRYLERNLNASVPVDNGAPTGTYTVIVQFIVGKDGGITEVKPLTNHGYGMETEVIRIIGKGPNWSPAILNGRTVKAYRKQPVTFMVISDIEISTKIIYAGKSNPIEITVDYLKPEDVAVTVSYGTISHEGSNKYSITVDSPGEMVLTVWDKSKKKKTEVGKEKIEVR